MGIATKTVTADQLEKFRARVALAEPKDTEVDAEDDKPVDEGYVAGDPLALRGVPLVGVHGVGGVIAGTRPGDAAWRLDKDERYLKKRRQSQRRRHLGQPQSEQSEPRL